MQVQRDAGVSA